MLDKLKELIGCFALYCCGYELMSNHYHLVLSLDRDAAKARTRVEVIGRWHSLFKGSVLTVRFLPGQSLTRAERDALDQFVIQ
jgi:hypothetical protein